MIIPSPEGFAAPLIVLLTALALDAVLPVAAAGQSSLRTPGAVGRFVLELVRRLDRAQRGAATRIIRGLLLTLLVAGGAAAAGWGVAAGAKAIGFWPLTALGLVVVLELKRSYRAGRKVVRALRAKERWRVQTLLRAWSGRHTEALDDHALARLSIETTTQDLAGGVIAPVMWFLLLGLPGACLARAVRDLDRIVSRRADADRRFGLVPARLNDALALVPRWIAAILIVAAALAVPGARPLAAMRASALSLGRSGPLTSGWPLAAMGGALDVALGGPRRTASGAGEWAVWIGGQRARAVADDVGRALYLFAAAALILAALLAAPLVAGGGLIGRLVG